MGELNDLDRVLGHPSVLHHLVQHTLTAEQMHLITYQSIHATC